MNFFFKTEKIVLDCFTDNLHVYETARINHGTKFFPEWWKNLPANHDTWSMPESQNMKACAGFRDLFLKSLILPVWSETEIEVKPDCSFSWRSANQMRVSGHESFQYEGLFSGQNLAQIKILSPWMLKSKQNLQIMILEPFWNNQRLNNFRVIPGIINTKYIPQCNVNGFVQPLSNESKLIHFEPLTPLAYLVPLTEKNIELKFHLMEENRLNQKFRYFHYLRDFNHFRKRIKASEKVEQLNKTESKCPFGFKKS
jgi:hypothetical protein